MTEQQKGVITLIKSALDGKAYPLPEGFSMEAAVNTALRHKIIALVYYGAVNCGVDKKSVEMQKLFPYVISTMNVVERQYHAYQQICKELEAEGVDYLPMKGVIMQMYYPRKEMRTMGDVDVLIRNEQYPQVSAAMQRAGFHFDREGDHEYVWMGKKLEAEIHRAFLPAYARDAYGYFAEPWNLAVKAEEGNTKYRLSNEDFFLFMFIHFTKHYRVAGIGIKHMVDLWVYKNAHPELDEAHILHILEKMQLGQFYVYMMEALRSWFADGQVTRRSDYITQVLFTNGEYGLAANRQATMILMDAQKEGSVAKVRRNRILRVIFPSSEIMKQQYKVLNKLPFLLPVFWVVRWFRTLFFKRSAIKQNLGKGSGKRHSEVQERKQALAFVGLDFEKQE